MVCDAPYFQNEFGDLHFFFYVFDIILSFSTYSKKIEKNLCVGTFGRERP